MSKEDIFGHLGQEALGLARQSIASYFDKTPDSAEYSHPRFEEAGACFVTLMIYDDLRGCMGNLEASRRLVDDIRANARMAAFHDPRFPPLTLNEWEKVRIEVSLIGRIEKMNFSSQEEALGLLRPGIDGLTLTWGERRVTFLPQVWEMLPDPGMFLNQLKVKARLPTEFWDQAIRLERYQVQKWKEH